MAPKAASALRDSKFIHIHSSAELDIPERPYVTWRELRPTSLVRVDSPNPGKGLDQQAYLGSLRGRSPSAGGICSMSHVLLCAAAATAAVHTGAGSGAPPVLHHHAPPAHRAVVAHAPDGDGDADDMIYRPAPAVQSPAPVRTAAPVRTTPPVQAPVDPPPRPAPVAQTAPRPAPAPPAPAPAVTTTAASGGSSQQIIESAFGPLGAGAVAWATRVAACESGGNPTAQNPSGATGLFQFMPSTFASTPQGQSGASITDPTASAQAAAWMYSQGRASAWSCS